MELVILVLNPVLSVSGFRNLSKLFNFFESISCIKIPFVLLTLQVCSESVTIMYVKILYKLENIQIKMLLFQPLCTNNSDLFLVFLNFDNPWNILISFSLLVKSLERTVFICWLLSPYWIHWNLASVWFWLTVLNPLSSRLLEIAQLHILFLNSNSFYFL